MAFSILFLFSACGCMSLFFCISSVHSAFKVAIRIIIHDGFFFFDSEINKNNCNKGVYALKNGCERTNRLGWKGIIVLKAD